MAPQVSKFFKIVLHHNIESSSLKLPTKFTREHRGELSDAAQLVVSDGRIWKLGLMKERDQLFLRDGFHEFARHYSLCHGHLLVFKYKGLSCFDVAIYDHTNCQISYPSNNPIHLRSERPYFEIKLKRYNLARYLLDIPRDVSDSVKKSQAEQRFIWLETSDGRRWQAALRDRPKGLLTATKLKDFFVGNNLKVEDVCRFEVAGKDLFKVFIFTA